MIRTHKVAKFRTAGNTNEQVVASTACWLYVITPDLTTTGTITLRDQATAAGGSTNTFKVCAIGLTQAGIAFGDQGVLCSAGLTIQLSVNTDLTLVVYELVRT